MILMLYFLVLALIRGFKFPLVFQKRSNLLSTQKSVNIPIEFIDHLCNQIGSKAVLQEITQHLSNGTSPSYRWNQNLVQFRVKINNIVDVVNVNETMLKLALSSIDVKRKIEQTTARELIDYFILNSTYSSLITPWLYERANRDNVPLILRSLDVLKATANKSLVVLVDIENVGNFKKYFYTDYNGEINFSAPLVPQLMKASSFSSDDRVLSLERLGLSTFQKTSESSSYDLNLDSDILVLAYAHTRSPLSAWANRRITDSRKDAADAMMLFDLGSLQHSPSIQHILLITGDGFGSSAAACFDSFSDRSSSTLDYPINRHDTNSPNLFGGREVLTKLSPNGRYKWMSENLSSGQPVFKWVMNCSEAANILGRIVL